MQQVDNLWPEYLGNIEISAPVQILAKQAEYFNGMMQNVLVATVDSHIWESNAVWEGNAAYGGGKEIELAHELKIKMPSLGNYSLTVLRMRHNAIKPYPVYLYNAITGQETKKGIGGEEELVHALRNIFNSGELNQAISTLLAQVKFLAHGERA